MQTTLRKPRGDVEASLGLDTEPAPGQGDKAPELQKQLCPQGWFPLPSLPDPRPQALLTHHLAGTHGPPPSVSVVPVSGEPQPEALGKGPFMQWGQVSLDLDTRCGQRRAEMS